MTTSTKKPINRTWRELANEPESQADACPAPAVPTTVPTVSVRNWQWGGQYLRDVVREYVVHATDAGTFVYGGDQIIPIAPPIPSPDPNNRIEMYLAAIATYAARLEKIMLDIDWHVEEVDRLFTEQDTDGIVTGIIQQVPEPGSNDDPVSIIFERSYHTITLTNAGPGNVQYQIPSGSSGQWITVLAGASTGHLFSKGRVKTISLRTVPPIGGPPPGPTATVQIVGTY